MASLLEFARLNRIRAAKGVRAFSFWGNVRFDASWTPARCELLAASGLVAVSGGIEIATSRGLEMTDKGFDLPSLVRTLVAMRRAGLLVHAYLIYGFPGQDAVDIVDSAEFCRQLFASGLVGLDAFLSGPASTGGPVRALVRIRQNHRPAPASVSLDGERATVRFDDPQRAVAPGQSAVFYDAEGFVLGGCVIESAVKQPLA